jgi:hypothetical protein
METVNMARPRWLIEVLRDGERVGYVGKRDIKYDPRRDLLDTRGYRIPPDPADAVTYVTRSAAQAFLAEFAMADPCVCFRVVRLRPPPGRPR